GPNLDAYDSIIVVEGRADVINLLKHGIKNVIAIEGTSVPQTIIDLSKEKSITAFLDGDRGGDLILKELLATCEIDFVARALGGEEVEELTKKEIFKCLREKVPVNQIKDVKKLRKRKIYIDEEKKKIFKTILEDLIGTRAACFLNEKMEILGKVPIKEIFNTMKRLDAKAVVIDGDIDQRMVNFGSHNGIKYMVGMRSVKVRSPQRIKVLTMDDLK
ncbi:MAG: toprim domain-containing protein, partial [Methanosarcinales archaeon]